MQCIVNGRAIESVAKACLRIRLLWEKLTPIGILVQQLHVKSVFFHLASKSNSNFNWN